MIRTAQELARPRLSRGNSDGASSMTFSRLTSDLRVVLLAVVLCVTPTNPGWTLRQGAIVAAFVVLLSVGSGAFGKVDLWAAAYGAMAYLSVLWATDIEVSELGAVNTAACVVLFVATRASIQNAKQLRFLAWSFVLGCSYGLYRLIADGAQLRWLYDPTAERVGIDGLNFNALAYALLAGAVLAVALRWARPAQGLIFPRLVLLGTWAILYAGIILSGTRGALIGVIALALWIALLHRFGKIAYIGTIWALVLGHVLSATGVVDALLTRFAAEGRDAGDLSGRLVLWPVAREAFWERPLFGGGVDSIRADPENVLQAAAHHMSLDIITGLGVVGLYLFVAVVISSVRESSGWISPRRTYLLGAFLIAVIPVSLTGFWTEGPAFWVLLAVMSRIGVIASPEGAQAFSGDITLVSGGK